MTPALHHVGARRSPVVVVDGFMGNWQAAVEAAAALAPFPPAGNYYPGVRRMIAREDGAAHAYVDAMLEAAAPFIGGAFDVTGFDLLEASFSLVTADPATLEPQQRAPHFDSLDPDYLAVLHFLSDTPDTGTAFFRQRATGIELLDDYNVARFVETSRAEGAEPGYIRGSNPSFEQIAAFDGIADRLLIYRGASLHSGIIPAGMPLSADPRLGRLTANIFVQGRRR